MPPPPSSPLGDHPMDESPCKTMNGVSSDSMLSSAKKKETPRQSKKNGKKKPSLAPPMGFTPSPVALPPPPSAEATEDTNDENKGAIGNIARRLHLGHLGFGTSPAKQQTNKQVSAKAAKQDTDSPPPPAPPPRGLDAPLSQQGADEVTNTSYSSNARVCSNKNASAMDTSVQSILNGSPSYLTVDDLASIIVVQSVARKWMVNNYIVPYVQAGSPGPMPLSPEAAQLARTKGGRDGNINRSVNNRNTSAVSSVAPSTPSPIKCRSLLSGSMMAESIMDMSTSNYNDTTRHDTTHHDTTAHSDQFDDSEVNLSNLAVSFDAKINAAAAKVQAEQMDAEDMARKRRVMVQDAMKSRFAANAAVIAGDAQGEESSKEDQDIRRGSASFGTTTTATIANTPESKRKPDDNDTSPCPSVPSVGLSAMVDDYDNGDDDEPEPNVSVNTTATGMSPAAASADTSTAISSGKDGNKLPGETSMWSSFCDISAIPENGEANVSGLGDNHKDVSPSKINLNYMLSICEEEEDDGSVSRVSVSVPDESNVSRASRRMPSVCDGSNDLSAMCDFVIGGDDSVADAAASADKSALADRTVNVSAARAAIAKEPYVPPPTPMTETPTNKDMNKSTCSGDMIAHQSASELDMRGVSIYNNSTDNLLKSDHVNSNDEYNYPPTSPSSETHSGSGTNSSVDSYDYYSVHKDFDKSAASDLSPKTKKPTCRMWSKMCLIITVPFLFIGIGGIIWYSLYAPGGRFSSNEVPSNGSPTIQDEDGGVSIIAGPTSMPSLRPTLPKLEFQPDTNVAPKPAPVAPTQSPTRLVETEKPIPAPVSPPLSFQGHETFSFYVIGDVPYTQKEEAIAEHQIKTMSVDAVPYLDNEGAQFVVHVGDIMKGGNRADCSKWRYEMIEDMYKDYCPVPAFMLPGDNDWYDCPNPKTGWANWHESFADMEVHWDGSTSLPSRVMRQSIRKENFAFTHGGVLFIGANLVSKEPYDIGKNLRARMNENRQWIRQIVDKYRFKSKPSTTDAESIRAIILFGHHRQSQFWRSLQKDLQPLKVPIVYYHGNGHSWYSEEPFSDWNNFWISQVDMGGIAPPIRVTIQGTTDISRQYPLRALSPYHLLLGKTIHVDRRGGTDKGPWSTSSFD